MPIIRLEIGCLITLVRVGDEKIEGIQWSYQIEIHVSLLLEFETEPQLTLLSNAVRERLTIVELNVIVGVI